MAVSLALAVGAAVMVAAWPVSLLDVVLLGPAHEALRRWLAGNPELDPHALRRTLPKLAWKAIERS